MEKPRIFIEVPESIKQKLLVTESKTNCIEVTQHEINQLQRAIDNRYEYCLIDKNGIQADNTYVKMIDSPRGLW